MPARTSAQNTVTKAGEQCQGSDGAGRGGRAGSKLTGGGSGRLVHAANPWQWHRVRQMQPHAKKNTPPPLVRQRRRHRRWPGWQCPWRDPRGDVPVGGVAREPGQVVEVTVAVVDRAVERGVVREAGRGRVPPKVVAARIRFVHELRKATPRGRVAVEFDDRRTRRFEFRIGVADLATGIPDPADTVYKLDLAGRSVLISAQTLRISIRRHLASHGAVPASKVGGRVADAEVVSVAVVIGDSPAAAFRVLRARKP